MESVRAPFKRLPRLQLEAIWLLAPLLPIALCVVGYRLGAAYLVDRTEVEGLFVAPQDLDFGSVWATDRFAWTFPIENRTHDAIVISEFQISCQCTSVEPKSLRIPAGQSANIHVTLDLTIGRGESANVARSFSVQILPITSSSSWSQRPQGWKLTGTATDVLQFSPATVELGDVVSGDPIAPQVVSVIAHAPVSEVGVKLAPQIADVRVFADAEASDHFILEVTPSEPPHVLGKFIQEIVLEPLGRDGVTLPLVVLPLTGNVVFDVSPTVDRIVFGRQKVGETVTGTVLFSSKSGSRFEIQPIKESQSHLSVSRRALPPEAIGQAFDIKLRVRETGDQVIQTKFHATNISSGEQAVLEVPIVFYGYETTNVLDLRRTSAGLSDYSYSRDGVSGKPTRMSHGSRDRKD